MQLTDQRDIKAPPETVWAAILDPDMLKAAVPGCESMTGTPDTQFEAVVTQKVGPVKATFKGVVTLSDMVPNQSLRISGEGKGGPAGFAKGGADVTLEATETGTRLSYVVEASVGGKIAQLGSRIIDGFAKKMADEFFTRFQDALEAPQEGAAEDTDAQAAAARAQRGASASMAGQGAILAPAAGRVLKVEVTAGSAVSPGMSISAMVGGQGPALLLLHGNDRQTNG